MYKNCVLNQIIKNIRNITKGQYENVRLLYFTEIKKCEQNDQIIRTGEILVDSGYISFEELHNIIEEIIIDKNILFILK